MISIKFFSVFLIKRSTERWVQAASEAEGGDLHFPATWFYLGGNFAMCVCQAGKMMIALSLHKTNEMHFDSAADGLGDIEQLPLLPLTPRRSLSSKCVPQFGWGWDGFMVQRAKQQLIVYSSWPAER